MPGVELIPIVEKQKWLAALQVCGEYDVYHLPQYHQLAQEQGEGTPYLFALETKRGISALPFLVRNVNTVESLENFPYMDATSVYGYPGVVSSLSEKDTGSEEHRSIFQKKLFDTLNDLKCISLFSRGNPLVGAEWLLKDIGGVESIGETVAIDLKQDEQKQMKNISKGHRYDIRKAFSMGVEVVWDREFSYLDDFIEIYNQTMTRNLASSIYYFNREYYLRLKVLFREKLRLYIAIKDGVVVSASLFFFKHPIVQYHLSGTPVQYLSLGGSKLIIEKVRKDACELNYQWLHLGGGVGSQDNPLFRFKAGFSKVRLIFSVSKLIIDPDVYAKASYIREKYLQEKGRESKNVNFFPKYRAY